MQSPENHNAMENDLVKPSTVSGKGLFAWKDFDSGEALLTVPRPLVIALNNTRLPDTCSNCFQWTAPVFQCKVIDVAKPPKLKTCTGCKTLRYCSKQCQTESWNREHKHTCKLLGKTQRNGILPNAARAVLQMLQIAAGPNGRQLREMKSHLNEITNRGGARAENVVVLSMGIHEYSGTPFGVEFVQEMFALVFTNSLTLYTASYDPLGICLDPLAAKANHSCEPNCIVVWDGPELQIRTLKPIRKGDEAFISYIDPSQPYSRRQHELRNKFYFLCECSLCQLRWSGPCDQFAESSKPPFKSLDPSLFMKPSREEIAKPVMAEILRNDKDDPDNLGNKSGLSGVLKLAQKLAYTNFEMSNTKGELEHMALLGAGLEACRTAEIWPESRQPLPIIRYSAFYVYLALGLRFAKSYNLAFGQGLKLYFESWPTIHPQSFHPMRVILSWTLANLALLLASESTQQDAGKTNGEYIDYGVVIWGFLMEVKSNVEKSHGKGHGFTAVIKRKVDEVKTDMTRADPSRINWAEQRIEQQWKLLRGLAHEPSVNTFNQFKKETDHDIDKIVKRATMNDE